MEKLDLILYHIIKYIYIFLKIIILTVGLILNLICGLIEACDLSFFSFEQHWFKFQKSFWCNIKSLNLLQVPLLKYHNFVEMCFTTVTGDEKSTVPTDPVKNAVVSLATLLLVGVVFIEMYRYRRIIHDSK